MSALASPGAAAWPRSSPRRRRRRPPLRAPAPPRPSVAPVVTTSSSTITRRAAASRARRLPATLSRRRSWSSPRWSRGAAGLDEQRRDAKSRPRGDEVDHPVAAPAERRAGGRDRHEHRRRDQRIAATAAASAGARARARPVRPSSLSARSTRPATPSNRSPLHTGDARSTPAMPDAAATGRSASAQTSHSATSGSPQPAHRRAARARAPRRAPRGRSQRATGGVHDCTIAAAGRGVARRRPSRIRWTRGATRSAGEEPVSLAACPAAWRARGCRMPPAASSCRVGRRARRPRRAAARSRRRCRPRCDAIAAGAVVVAAGPPTSCSRTCDSSPSCESTPTVVSSSQATPTPVPATAPIGTGSPEPLRHPVCRSADDARDPDLGPRAGRDERGEPRAVSRHRHRRRSGWRPATHRRPRPRVPSSRNATSAPGCARGTLHTMSNGSMVGSTSPARASSRSDEPSAPWRATVPSVEPQRRPVPLGRDLDRGRGHRAHDLGESGDRLELVPDEESEARLGEHERGPGHAGRAHRHRLRRRSAHRRRTVTTSVAPAVREARLELGEHPVQRLGRDGEGRLAEVDLGDAGFDGHRRRDRHALGERRLRPSPRASRSRGLLTRASATRVAAFAVGNHRTSGTRYSHVGSKYMTE